MGCFVGVGPVVMLAVRTGFRFVGERGLRCIVDPLAGLLGGGG